MSAQRIKVEVDARKEIAEIACDFEKPTEVLREAVANSYDALAKEVTIAALSTNDPAGRRILNLHIADDGLGMDEQGLHGFFGLGFTHKPPSSDRPSIGFKGHGTKIYYFAAELWVATKRSEGSLLVARVANAREQILHAQLPEPEMWRDAEARDAAPPELSCPRDRGTSILLIDYTADSGRLIDRFKREFLENYLRWFSVYGSFRHVVLGTAATPPLTLRLQATDDSSPQPVEYGHPWPKEQLHELRILKKKDERRPFNFFCKWFYGQSIVVSGGYRIDIAALFEGRRGRQQRDRCIRRQRAGGLYAEEERYGLWLCRDHIPVELRSKWLQDERLGTFAYLEPKRALVLVNCQNFWLTANRGSVGNSPGELLAAVREGTVAFLEGIEDDPDLVRFANEYEEERLARLREKDKRAFVRRLERYNKKVRCSIELPDGTSYEFFEPQREITLYGLLSELLVVDPKLLELEILDYDDHRGLDLLVRRASDPGDLLNRDLVAYAEIKYRLESRINHSFENLHAIICWESMVSDGSSVEDVTDVPFTLHENLSNGVTHSVLVPRADSRYTHQVKVLVLKRLLREQRSYSERKNPRQVRK